MCWRALGIKVDNLLWWIISLDLYSCECPESYKCVRAGDDLSASAYVHRCRQNTTADDIEFPEDANWDEAGGIVAEPPRVVTPTWDYARDVSSRSITAGHLHVISPYANVYASPKAIISPLPTIWSAPSLTRARGSNEWPHRVPLQHSSQIARITYEYKRSAATRRDKHMYHV